MKNARKRWSLGASLTLVAGSLLMVATPMAANASPSPNACSLQPRVGHIAGIVPAIGHCSGNDARINSDPASGTPPLLFNGGSVMMTPSSSPLVITPIFWNPSGHTMASAYKSLISTYISDVAAASGQTTNVYSVLNEYSGNNGQIHYSVSSGAAINDTNALPRSGCTVASNDRSGIYADGTGYNACLDDAQLQSQVNSVTSAHGLPRNLSHIYVLLLPKAVESCFNAGSTTTSANQCTINHNPSAAFCAYHSEDSASAIYANMPFPVYESSTGFTCGTEANFGVVESPNNNPDADVEISPTSHEVSEAITDPDTATGWFDSSGFEIGDECAFTFGATQGNAGQLFNQTINGGHFLTQEEFSNKDFAITGGGCVQSANAEA
ncbi:MAG: hypothetical protein JO345_28340 [Streptosporangiaceae bacterium]|nr:hypothetical protein [Streptosporangiaceae bacterium]